MGMNINRYPIMKPPLNTILLISTLMLTSPALVIAQQAVDPYQSKTAAVAQDQAPSVVTSWNWVLSQGIPKPQILAKSLARLTMAVGRFICEGRRRWWLAIIF